MNTFLQRKILTGSVLAIGLLGAMQIPAAFAGEGQAGHEHTSSQSHEPASKPAASPQGQPSQGEQMKHGDMDHSSMNNSEMGHDTMSGEHNATEAGADSNHDH